MTTSGPAYPWYTVVTGDDLEQGDILEECPVLGPPDQLALQIAGPGTQLPFECEFADVIVMTQSCDLVLGRGDDRDEVLLCAVWQRSEFTEGPFQKSGDWENARKGRMPAYHVLAHCNEANFKRGPRLVDFGRLYTLPLSFVRIRAAARPRIRLMPPYREHLSQAFARKFMRVGLPVDITPFK